MLNKRDSGTRDSAIEALNEMPDVAAIPEGFREGIIKSSKWLYENTVQTDPYSGMLAMYVYLGKWWEREHTFRMTDEEEKWYDDSYKLHALVHCVVLAKGKAMLDLKEHAKKSKSTPMGGGWTCPDIASYWTGRGKSGEKVTHTLHDNIGKFSVAYGADWLVRRYGKKHGYKE